MTKQQLECKHSTTTTKRIYAFCRWF